MPLSILPVLAMGVVLLSVTSGSKWLAPRKAVVASVRLQKSSKQYADRRMSRRFRAQHSVCCIGRFNYAKSTGRGRGQGGVHSFEARIVGTAAKQE